MTNETEQEFSNEYQKLLWKRQHGMLSCVICNRILDRFPSNLMGEKVIDGKRYWVYLSKFSVPYRLNTLNKHLKCLKEKCK